MESGKGKSEEINSSSPIVVAPEELSNISSVMRGIDNGEKSPKKNSMRSSRRNNATHQDFLEWFPTLGKSQKLPQASTMAEG